MSLFDNLMPGLTQGADALGGALQTGFGIANFFRQDDWRQEAMAREDTAVQRRAADLKAAGINPLLAAGQAAASMAPMSTQAPRFDRGFSQSAQAAQQAALNRDLRVRNEAEIRRVEAQIGMSNAQAASARAQAEQIEFQTFRGAYDLEHAQRMGQRSDQPYSKGMRTASEITGLSRHLFNRLMNPSESTKDWLRSGFTDDPLPGGEKGNNALLWLRKVIPALDTMQEYSTRRYR